MVHTDQLIDELMKREIAVAMGIVRQDETTGTDQCLIGKFYHGDEADCLYALTYTINALLHGAREKGIPDREIREIMGLIQIRHLIETIEDDEYREDEFDPEDDGPDYGDMGPYPDAPQG
jgi:hypothetical protein